MVKRREKMKKDDLQLSIDIYEKRYQAKDFTGQLLAEYTAATTKTRYFRMTKAINLIFIIIFLILDLHSHPSTQINFIIIPQPTWHRILLNGTPPPRHKTTRVFISIIICRTNEILMA
jgi:hypothetical protein